LGRVDRIRVPSPAANTTAAREREVIGIVLPRFRGPRATMLRGEDSNPH
jgi:hypothetical protein